MNNNLYLIIGDNLELVNFYLLKILNKFNDIQDKKIEYDLGNDSFSSLLDEGSMINLFAKEKIIIGNNFNLSNISDIDIEYLDNYLKNINKDIYIILITNKIDTRLKKYKIFKDNFNIIDVNKLNSNLDISKYIRDYINNNNYQIDKYTLEYLISKLGTDINNINLELDKIFLYKKDDKIIDRKTIDLLILDNIDNIVYEFTNAILEKDIDKVSKMYNNFKLYNMGYDYLLVSISNCFRQSLIIKILYNDGKSNYDISKIIGKKEFYVKKMIDRLYNYEEKDLSLMINELAKIDREFKTGISNIDKLELFLLNNSN